MARFAWVVLAAVGLAAAVHAEPLKPAVEVRLLAGADLVPFVEYAGQVFGQEEGGKQFAGLLKTLADSPELSMGLDLKKPIGGYAVLTEKVEESTVVLMIPVADEDAFVATLKDKAGLDPKKDAKTGVYSVDVPNVPSTVYFRIADGYAYATLRSADGVDKAKLIAPKTFFADKLTGVLSANVFFDRIPADLRKAAYGQLELQLKEGMKADADPVSKKIQEFVIDAGVDAVKTLLTDGDTLTLSLGADPKADEVALTLTVTPKKDTTLAKTLALWADRDSIPAALTTKNPMLALGVNFAFPPETAKKLGTLAEGLAKDAADAAEGKDKLAMKLVADAVLPTLKKGDAQLGLVMTADAKGKVGLTGAMKAVDGKEVEKTAKLFATQLPKEVEFTADADKVGERKVHKVKFPDGVDLPFASDTLWLLTSDDLLAFSADEKADGVKAVGGAKAVKAPMLSFEMGWVQFSRWTQTADADTIKNVVNSVFDDGKTDGKDTLKVTVSGGKQLTVNVAVKGKALTFLASLTKAK